MIGLPQNDAHLQGLCARQPGLPGNKGRVVDEPVDALLHALNEWVLGGFSREEGALGCAAGGLRA